MQKSIREIVLKGFDSNDPSTQSLVIWVSGSEPDIIRVTSEISDDILSMDEMDIGIDLGDALGIDFQLPKHETEFLTHVDSVIKAHQSN